MADSLFLKNYPLIKIFKSGDIYIVYDAKSDFAFAASDKEIKFLKAISGDEPSDKFNGEKDFIKFSEKISALKKCGIFIPGALGKIGLSDKKDFSELVDYYEKFIVTRKFNIELTEDCNFRCHYCPNTLATTGRTHTKKYITEEIACRAIDNYYNRFTGFLSTLSSEKKQKLLKMNEPGIGYYGGEPLLNFEVLKKSHKYFLSLEWEKYSADKSAFVFGLTSNLGKISEEIIDYLVENHFLLYVSLDGPAEEHNKNRVFAGGGGTFDTVYKNLMRIKSKYPEYYRTKVFIISVSTKNLDKEKCDEFFSEIRNGEIGGFKHRIMSDYSERGKIIPFADEKLEELRKNKSFNLRIFENKIRENNFFTVQQKEEFLDEYCQGLNRFLKIKYDKPFGCNHIHSINTCPMGFDNLMVDSDGNYHMCHKTDGSLIIGNVWDGLDYNKIADAYLAFNSTLGNDNCKNCWAIRFCKACAAVKLDNGKFFTAQKDECDFIKESTEYLFEKFILLQRNDELTDFFEERESQNVDSGIIDINYL